MTADRHGENVRTNCYRWHVAYNGSVNFEYNLIKGRIAESVFETMFHATKKFTVLRFGYESTVSMLAQYRNIATKTEVIEQVSGSPDFVLVTEDRKQVYFVEVKYRALMDDGEMLAIAKKLSMRWGLCYLFVISTDGFFFSPIHSIVNNCGRVEKLPTRWVSKSLQNQYFALAQDFLLHHRD